MKNLCVLCGLILGLLTACGDLFGPEDAPHALWVGETGLVLEPGETVRLSAKAMETRNSLVEAPRGASWSSDDSSVVEVRGNGAVRAVAPGRATVWVNVGTKHDSATVLVRELGTEDFGIWSSVDVGGGTVCALTRRAKAYCWGSDYFGQLGDGVRRQWTRTLAPKEVSGGHAFAELAVGERHGCGRTDAGRVHCWGDNEIGGTGSGDNQAAFQLDPSEVAFVGKFERIQAKGWNTGGITTEGDVVTWGSNAHGQIGDGTGGIDEFRASPTRVKTTTSFASVSVGDSYMCALSDSDHAWCWGDNFHDGLGLNAPANRHQLTPHPVWQGELRFKSISEGGGTCGLTATGETYCWGSGISRMAEAGDPPPSYPQVIQDAPVLARLYAGTASQCGLSAAGEAFCWGWNEHGELGTDDVLPESCGSSGSSAIPCTSRPVAVAGNHRFRQLSSASGTTCGVTVEGDLYCWGSNFDGQLGNGSLLQGSQTPVRVTDPL